MNGAGGSTSAGASGDAAKITFRRTSTEDTNPQLNEIRKSTKKFCDVKISFVGNVHIYAHKFILQTASTVFEEWLGSSESSNADKLNEELAPFGREAVDSIISFLYTGKLEVDFSDLNNLELLISAAQRLRIDEINLNSCAELLLEVLSVNNCWTIQSFAQRNRRKLPEVLSHVDSWIKNHLPTILDDGNFQNLSYAQMKIAVQNAVPISSSEKLFATIVAWVSHSEDDRKEQVFILLQLAKIFTRAPHLVLQSDEFRRLALAKSKKSNPQQLPSSLSSLNMRQNQSSPASTSGNASSTAPKSNIQSEDTGPQNKRRRELESTPAPPPPPVEEPADSENHLADEQMDVANNDNFVTLSPNPNAFAGRLEAEAIKFLYPRITEEKRGRGTITEKQFYTFDFKTKTSKLLFKYDTAREQSSIIVHRGKVFDIGGRVVGRNSSELTTIYDISSEIVYPGPSLSNSAYEAAVCLLNNCIYVIGGCEAHGHVAPGAHNCTQMLDLNKNPLKFQETDCMNFCRGAFDAEVLDGKIYAVGGIGKKVFKKVNNWEAYPLKTVEVYDPKTKKWKLLPPKSNLKEARGYFKLCSLENKLYAP